VHPKNFSLLLLIGVQIPGTYCAYKEEHFKGPKTGFLNPNKAGFFNGFLNFVLFFFIFKILNINLIGGLITCIIFLPTLFFYFFGAKIYEDTPNEEELAKEGRDIFYFFKKIVELEEKISTGTYSQHKIQEMHKKKNDLVRAIRWRRSEKLDVEMK